MADNNISPSPAPSSSSCCGNTSCNGRTNFCDTTPCVLGRADHFIQTDRVCDARDVLKAVVDSGNACELVHEKYKDVCCLLERKGNKNYTKRINLENTFNEIERTRQIEMNMEAGDELDCVLCLKLLYEPVTTPCGHTFCKMCLARVIDYTSACPLCRTVLHLDDPTQLPQSVVLSRVIQRWFPNLYEERKKEMQIDPCLGETFSLPLCSLNAVVFPGQKFPMHIFEPRYRLMLRRVMAGARKFGLVKYTKDDQGNMVVAEIGALLEVKKAERTPDGRSIIDTTGIGRFRVLEQKEMDGYIVAKVEMYYDTCGLEGEEVAERAQKARRYISDLLNRGGRCPTMQNALQRIGPVPSEGKGPSALSLWLAGALVTDLNERQRLLEMCDANARLKEMSCCLERYYRNRFCPYSGFGRNKECTVQ